MEVIQKYIAKYDYLKQFKKYYTKKLTKNNKDLHKQYKWIYLNNTGRCVVKSYLLID